MRYVAISALAVTLCLVGAPAHAQTPAKASAGPELFGTPLKGASRTTLRAVFHKSGLQTTREDSRYWVDEYSANGVLKGASEFSAGYVSKTGQFAFAEYTFEGFMDTGLVSKVARMVQAKYGQPSSRRGNDGLGEVTYTWNLPQGMAIEVSRGWPETTTYLRYVDRSNFAALKAEQAQNNRTQEQANARAQSNAF